MSEQTIDKPVYSFCYGDRFAVTNETTGEIIIDADNETDGLSTLLGLYEDAQARIAAHERKIEELEAEIGVWEGREDAWQTACTEAEQERDAAQMRIAELEHDAELGRLVRQAVDSNFSLELWRRFDGKGYVAVLGTSPAQGGDTLEEAVRKAVGLMQPALHDDDAELDSPKSLHKEFEPLRERGFQRVNDPRKVGQP